MYKILRITFCILAVILAAAAVFIFIFGGWLWGLMAVIVAAVFAALMVTFKQLQEKEELKANPPPPQGDFITGAIKQTDDQTDNKADGRAISKADNTESKQADGTKDKN